MLCQSKEIELTRRRLRRLIVAAFGGPLLGFKYRNKIGMDTVLESLRLYKSQRRTNVDALLHYASICRVSMIIRP